MVSSCVVAWCALFRCVHTLLLAGCASSQKRHPSRLLCTRACCATRCNAPLPRPTTLQALPDGAIACSGGVGPAAGRQPPRQPCAALRPTPPPVRPRRLHVPASLGGGLQPAACSRGCTQHAHATLWQQRQLLQRVPGAGGQAGPGGAVPRWVPGLAGLPNPQHSCHCQAEVHSGEKTRGNSGEGYQAVLGGGRVASFVFPWALVLT